MKANETRSPHGGGDWYLQDHGWKNEGLSVDMRALTVCKRQTSRPAEEIGADGKREYHEETHGDLIGSLAWEPRDTSDGRPMAGWRMTPWPVRTMTEERLDSFASCGTLDLKNLEIAPIFDVDADANDWRSDVGYKPKPCRIPHEGGSQATPTPFAGAYGILTAADREDRQDDLFQITDPRIIAVNKAGDPEMGAWVCDLDRQYLQDTDYTASIQSAVRVLRFAGAGVKCGPWPDTLIALQVNRSGCGESVGGIFFDTGEHGGTGMVIGKALGSGAVTAGAGAADKHCLGSDADGHPIVSMHIDANAYFYKGEEFDAPLKFDDRYRGSTAGPLRVDVCLEYDGDLKHPWCEDKQPGMWRWVAKTFVESSDPYPGIPPSEPPPIDVFPPPPNPLPPENPGGAVHGPGGIIIRPPGGFPAGGAGEGAPGPFDAIGNPTLAGHERHAHLWPHPHPNDSTGASTAFGPQIPPIGPEVEPESPPASPSKPASPGSPGDGLMAGDLFNTSAFGAGSNSSAAGGYIEERLGLVPGMSKLTEQTVGNTNPARSCFGQSVNELASPGLLFQPQMMSDGATDIRTWTSAPRSVCEDYKANSPLVARLESFGRQTASGQSWSYFTEAGDLERRYPRGSAHGGLVFLPPQVDVADYAEGRESSVSTSDAAFVISDLATFALGSPSVSDDEGVATGIIHRFDADSYKGALRTYFRNSAKSATSIEVSTITRSEAVGEDGTVYDTAQPGVRRGWGTPAGNGNLSAGFFMEYDKTADELNAIDAAGNRYFYLDSGKTEVVFKQKVQLPLGTNIHQSGKVITTRGSALTISGGVITVANSAHSVKN